MYKYTHGGDVYDESGHFKISMLDFSAGINPLGMPAGALAAAKQAAELSIVYPDSSCRLLVSKLASFESVGENAILCGNGASDLIFRLVYAIKPKKILVTAPSFADYERAGRAAGAEVIYHYLKESGGFRITCELAAAIYTAAPDIVFLCNPNNPTGNLTDMDTLTAIAEACKSVNAVLLVDECFLDFVQDSGTYTAKKLLSVHKTIVVLKAFTKIFAMPGLRLGYAICENSVLLDRMRFYGPDWPVSTVAQAAGIAALEVGRKYIEKTANYIRDERERMTTQLERLGMTVYPSSANFIFFRDPWCGTIRDKLQKYGVLIRDCQNFTGLDSGYYRVAVLTNEKNTRLLEALKEVKAAWQNQS